MYECMSCVACVKETVIYRELIVVCGKCSPYHKSLTHTHSLFSPTGGYCGFMARAVLSVSVICTWNNRGCLSTIDKNVLVVTWKICRTTYVSHVFIPRHKSLIRNTFEVLFLSWLVTNLSRKWLFFNLYAHKFSVYSNLPECLSFCLFIIVSLSLSASCLKVLYVHSCSCNCVSVIFINFIIFYAVSSAFS